VKQLSGRQLLRESATAAKCIAEVDLSLQPRRETRVRLAEVEIERTNKKPILWEILLQLFYSLLEMVIQVKIRTADRAERVRRTRGNTGVMMTTFAVGFRGERGRFGLIRATSSALLTVLLFTGQASCQETLVYSFESGLEGFVANGGGITVSQDTIGATEGTQSLKMALTGPTFVGAYTPMLHPAIGDPPGLDYVKFDLTITEPFLDEGQVGFAVIGVMIFGVTQTGTAVQLQTGPSDDPLLEFPIDGLAAGTYRDIKIDMTQFTHPETFNPATFNEIVGTLGSGPLDMIPTGFQLYINKSGGLAFSLTTYIDNIRVGTTPAAVAGDYSGNGVVDAADYTNWRDNLGLMDIATVAQGDGDGDGDVTSLDYTYWKTRFGNTASSVVVSATAVPEPGSMLILMIGSLAFGRSTFRKLRRRSQHFQS
jgi:hypothetical protein